MQHQAIHQAHIRNLAQVKQNEQDVLRRLGVIDCFEARKNRYVLEESTAPFIKESNTWLTIGDVVGFEASFLEAQQQQATASDIDDTLLRSLAERGYVKRFAVVNAEEITYEDDAFDYVYCKFTFHHFPRAYKALYEMVRVARKAAILVEPSDPLLTLPWLLLIKNVLDKFHPRLIDRLWKNRFSFEAAGNYVFKISPREIEKLAAGIGLPCVAFKVLHLPHVSQKIALDSNVDKHFRKWLRKVQIMTSLARLGIFPANHLCFVLFKRKPSHNTIRLMNNHHFVLLELPKNPYLNPSTP